MNSGGAWRKTVALCIVESHEKDFIIEGGKGPVKEVSEREGGSEMGWIGWGEGGEEGRERRGE